MSDANKIIKCSYTWTEVLKGAEKKDFSTVLVTNVNGELIKWLLRSNYYGYIKLNTMSFTIVLDCLSEYSSERTVSLTIHLMKGENIINTHQNQFNRNSMPTNSSKRKSYECYIEYEALTDDGTYNLKTVRFKNGNSYINLKDTSLRIICDITFDAPTVRIYDNCSATSSTDCGFNKFDNLEDYFESGKLSDVTIVAGGEEFRAHKLILSLRSKAFATMLNPDLWETSQAVIKIKNVAADVMREMLRFIYTGKIKDQDKVSGDLLELANRLEIDALKERCEQKLVQKAPKLKKHLDEFMAKKE